MQASEDAGEQGRKQLSQLATKDSHWIYSLGRRHLKSKRKGTRDLTVVDPELRTGGGA